MAASRLSGKVAIVTGAGSGIGRATAILLAQEGAQVVVADLDAETAEETAHAIVRDGGDGVAQRADVSSEDDVSAMVERAVRHYGALHVLHNNAAMTAARDHTHDGDLLTMTVEYWDRSFAVNLRGAMLGCKHAIPQMIASGGGSIINTSSNQSLAGDMSQFAYSAAKAGVNALSRSVATTYGRDGIRCNTVSPGPTYTAMTKAGYDKADTRAQRESMIPLGKLGQAEDVANAILFLLGPQASHITGIDIMVDGGMSNNLMPATGGGTGQKASK